MMASLKREWLSLAVSVGLAVVLSLGAIATFGGAGNAQRTESREATGIEVQTPDQTGTIGTDKGVKKFQTTDAYSLTPEHRAE